MAWRRGSTLIVLILANYLVFSLLATWVFPAPPLTPPTHVPRPTFTPGGDPLRNVDPLAYDFLTPSATPTATGAPPTETPTTTATRTPPFTLTLTRSP